MQKENFIQRLIRKILTKLGILKTVRISKIDMCENAKKSGICNGISCSSCAWNTKGDSDV